VYVLEYVHVRTYVHVCLANLRLSKVAV
jgi:hypothetical protein